MGNGTLTGLYQRIGKLCAVIINMTAGSTTTVGSGTYTFALPFPASSLGEQALGSDFYDAANHYGAVGLMGASSSVVQPNALKGGTAGSMVALGSTSFAAGLAAIIVLQGVYQVA